MNKKPIGVFDSGLGGLTAVRQLRQVLPGEHIVYFGDTGRVPYGNRSRETLVKFAAQDVAFLASKGVKAVVAACGTISSTLTQEEAAVFPVPYFGVVEAAVATATRSTKNGRIGVIGTEAAVGAGSYQRALAGLGRGYEVTANPCPLFVPLVEYGHFTPGDAMARLAAEEYLAPVKAAGVDTLILGCTHYPLLTGVIGEYMGDGVTLVDPGRETALALKDTLKNLGLLADGDEAHGRVDYYVSAAPTRFEALSRIFMGRHAGGDVELVDIEEYHL